MTGRAVFFVLMILVVGGLAHTFIVRWLFAAFPRTREKKRIVFGAAIALVLAPPLLRMLVAATHNGFASMLLAAAMTEYVVALFAIVPLLLVRIVAAIVGRFEKMKRIVPEAEAPSISRREMVERVGGGVVVAGIGSLIGWGAVRGRHAFVIDEVPVVIRGLPKVLDGYTIAQVSDIHVGNLVQERELAEGLDRLREVKSDLIVVTGDLVDFDPSYIPMMTRAIGDLRARDGVFAILGNHDYYTGARAIADALRAAGVDMLQNDGRVIRAADGGGFALLGVDDRWSAAYGGAGPRLDRALGMVPPDLARVLLSHQPTTFDRWAGDVALQLSGHTHGGQVNPIVRPADLVMHYVSGRYERNGSVLYVNRGFGVVGPPARIGAPPEVTKIVLVAG